MSKTRVTTEERNEKKRIYNQERMENPEYREQST